MNLDDRIEIKPGVMLGKPVIKGTRITVELILERLQAGETVEQITHSLKNIDIYGYGKRHPFYRAPFVRFLDLRFPPGNYPVSSRSFAIKKIDGGSRKTTIHRQFCLRQVRTFDLALSSWLLALRRGSSQTVKSIFNRVGLPATSDTSQNFLL